MKAFVKKAAAFLQDEEGASAIEYALLVGGIAVAIAAGVLVLGNNMANKFNSIASSIG